MWRSDAGAGDFDPSTAQFNPTPALRDTADVRAKGNVVLRFVANNPGNYDSVC